MILQELGHLKSKLAVTHEKEKEMYQRMFQQKKPATDEAKDDVSSFVANQLQHKWHSYEQKLLYQLKISFPNFCWPNVNSYFVLPCQ